MKRIKIPTPNIRSENSRNKNKKKKKIREAYEDDDDEPQQTTTAATSGCITKLPDHLLTEILSRIPVKTVFICMCVCKPWLAHLSDPYFAKTHFARAPVSHLLVSSDPYAFTATKTMHLIEGEPTFDLDYYHAKTNLISKRNYILSHAKRSFLSGKTLTFANFAVTMSCHGLVCFTTSYGGFPISLCNPVTGEYISFEEPRDDKTLLRLIFIGLGFSTRTNRHELLHMVERKVTNPSNGSVSVQWGPELCTLGTQPWRRVGDAPDFFKDDLINVPCKISSVIFLNGALYWMYTDRNFVRSFDFETEQFRAVSPAPRRGKVVRGVMNSMSLGVLGDCLCLYYFDRTEGKIDIWMMKGTNGGQETWTKQFHVENLPQLKENSRCPTGRFYPRPMLRYLNNRETLILYSSVAIIVFDLVTKTQTFLRVPRLRLEFDVVPHIPSLVSLKDLVIGDDVEVFKAEPWCSSHDDE